MRTILSLLLFPIIILAQHGSNQNEPPNIEFKMEFSMENIFVEKIDFQCVIDGAKELFITVEVFTFEMEINSAIREPIYDASMTYILPKYLNTFSLVGLIPNANETKKPQQRLNSLLALNDPMFPKEDTLFDWLHPIRYEQYKFGRADNMPEGFGPRIRI